MLRRASQDAGVRGEHLTSIAQDAEIGGEARRVSPSADDPVSAEEGDHSRSEASVRTDEILSDARVGTREYDRPREVTGGVDHPGAPGRPAHGRHPSGSSTKEVRCVVRNTDPVRDGESREHAHPNGRNSLAQEELVLPKLFDAGGAVPHDLAGGRSDRGDRAVGHLPGEAEGL